MNTSNTELNRLERFASVLRDDGVDVDAMDKEHLAHYLKENKVDMTEPQKRFNEILKKAKARRRLEVAKERRIIASERAQQMLSVGSDAVEAVRERVRGMIEKFRQHDPDQALIYAREFEKATPEDLKILEDDLMLLEMEFPSDGKSNKQDAG